MPSIPDAGNPVARVADVGYTLASNLGVRGGSPVREVRRTEGSYGAWLLDREIETTGVGSNLPFDSHPI